MSSLSVFSYLSTLRSNNILLLTGSCVSSPLDSPNIPGQGSSAGEETGPEQFQWSQCWWSLAGQRRWQVTHCRKLIQIKIVWSRIITLIDNLSTAPVAKNWNRLMSLQGVASNIGINFLNVSQHSIQTFSSLWFQYFGKWGFWSLATKNIIWTDNIINYCDHLLFVSVSMTDQCPDTFLSWNITDFSSSWILVWRRLCQQSLSAPDHHHWTLSPGRR